MKEMPRFCRFLGITIDKLAFSQNCFTGLINLTCEGSQEVPVIKSDAKWRNNSKQAYSQTKPKK